MRLKESDGIAMQKEKLPAGKETFPSRESNESRDYQQASRKR